MACRDRHLLFRCISVALTGMEDGQVVDVLDVALLEIKGFAVFLRVELQRVQCLGLCFTDGRNGRGPWRVTKSREDSPEVLYY